MSKFKPGDKVYCPLKSNKILTLQKNNSTFDYPLLAKGFSFTSDGKYSRIDTSPSIFHATPENHELLEKLYGVEFEAPPVKPTSRDIIQAMLARGDKCVPCWVSDDVEEPDIGCTWGFVEAYKDTKALSYETTDSFWNYATPFDPRTGEAITELPE